MSLALFACAAQGCASSGGDCSEKATCGDDGSPDDGTTGFRDGNGKTDGTQGNDGPGDGQGDGSGDANADATSDVATDGANDAGDAAIDSSAPPDTGPPDTGTTCTSGSTCVDPAPGGWLGPLALSQQTSGLLPPSPPPTAPACPTSWSDVYDGNGNLVAPQAVCGCTCGSLNKTGATCGPERVVVYNESTCGSACTSAIDVPASGGNDCVNLACDTGQGVIVTPAVATGGSCPATPSVTKPAAGWTSTARACLTPSMGAGCSGSSVCVPIPPSPYSSKLCVSKAGDVACPGGSYTQKNVFYGGLTADSRDCSSCVCTPSGLTCTGAKVNVYGPPFSGACDPTTTQALTVDGVCNPVTLPSLLYWASETKAPTLTGGTCSWTSGGQPVGTLGPTTPTTLCCQP